MGVPGGCMRGGGNRRERRGRGGATAGAGRPSEPRGMRRQGCGRARARGRRSGFAGLSGARRGRSQLPRGGAPRRLHCVAPVSGQRRGRSGHLEARLPGLWRRGRQWSRGRSGGQYSIKVVEAAGAAAVERDRGVAGDGAGDGAHHVLELGGGRRERGAAAGVGAQRGVERAAAEGRLPLGHNSASCCAPTAPRAEPSSGFSPHLLPIKAAVSVLVSLGQHCGGLLVAGGRRRRAGGVGPGGGRLGAQRGGQVRCRDHAVPVGVKVLGFKRTSTKVWVWVWPWGFRWVSAPGSGQ
jgi:hypothetical protein